MISIAMGYRNRKQLLIRTLDSMRKSEIKDYEVVIVDDSIYNNGLVIVDDCSED